MLNTGTTIEQIATTGIILIPLAAGDLAVNIASCNWVNCSFGNCRYNPISMWPWFDYSRINNRN